MKKIWSTIKIPLFLIVSITCLCSCQALALAYFGIKNPEKAVSKEKRFAYYEPFIDNQQAAVKLYALSDTTEWSKTIQKFFDASFPMIYLKNNETDSLYSLNCFEDISWDINLINDNNFQYLDLGDKEQLAYVKKVITNNAKLLYDSKKTVPNQSAKWQVFVVSATFLGKKLRKRTLPIFKLKDLGPITILDISKISEFEN